MINETSNLDFKMYFLIIFNLIYQLCIKTLQISANNNIIDIE